MGNTTTFLCFVIIFLTLVTNGSTQSQCSPSELKIVETPTGRTIEKKTEWKVKITNTCSCSILQLTLLCPNFDSKVKADPSILSKTDANHCLINNGQPVYAFTSISFTYAWDRVHFVPVYYTVACS